MQTVVIAAVSWLAYTVLLVVVDMLTQHSVGRALMGLRRWVIGRRLDRRAIAIANGKVERGLTRFYRQTPLKEGLDALPYRPDAPIYSPPPWRGPGVTLLDRSASLIVTDGKTQETTDRALLRKVRRRAASLGVDVWDGPALMVTHLPLDASSPVRAKTASYFDLAESIVPLEDEAFRHADNRWRRLRVRRALGDHFLDSPRGLGGVVALVVDDANGRPEILIHKRSGAVATNPGMWCVTPTYVVEDPQSSGKQQSVLGIEVHNVLREILEEVYGYPELNLPNRRIDPDWFLSLDLGEKLHKGISSGSVRCAHLGWYINLVNGLLDSITIVYASQDPELNALLRRSVNADSAEVAAGLGQVVRWIPLDSADLLKLRMAHDFHPGSALAIDLAQTFVSQIRGLNA